KKVEEKIVKPTVEGLLKENIDYRGFLFIGIMNVKGNPYVIEYNVRMGDPETQAVLPRMKSDFLELLHAIGSQTLADYPIETHNFATATVVMVSGGYPETYTTGQRIAGLIPSPNEKAITYHAGTKRNGAGNILTNGGRV